MRFPRPKSVFGRAFLVLVVSGVLTQIVIIFSILRMNPRVAGESNMRENVKRYTAHVARELAKQPTAEYAREFLRGTGFDARASGVTRWSTLSKPPERIVSVRMFADGEPLDIDDTGRPVFRVPASTPKGLIMFELFGPTGPTIERPIVPVMLFIGTLLAIFSIAAIFMHRILRPVGVLSSAFAEVKRGKTSISLPKMGDDELGRLTTSFNEMAASIDFLIKDKERLFTELSHEFRAPISRAIAANALVENEEIQGEIKENLAELDGLIHALLTAARLESGTTASLEKVELGELVEEVRRLFPQSNRRIAVAEKTGAVSCMADRRSLRTLFRNLVENALKYSPADSNVILQIGSDRGRVFVNVTDRGPGISEQELSKIFEPFFRGNDAEKVIKPGFGLGLALCRRIVSAHGGELHIQSKKGSGTTFTAWFKAA